MNDIFIGLIVLLLMSFIVPILVALTPNKMGDCKLYSPLPPGYSIAPCP